MVDILQGLVYGMLMPPGLALGTLMRGTPSSYRVDHFAMPLVVSAAFALSIVAVSGIPERAVGLTAGVALTSWIGVAVMASTLDEVVKRMALYRVLCFVPLVPSATAVLAVLRWRTG